MCDCWVCHLFIYRSDGAIGKTSLLISFAKGECPRDHVPTGKIYYTIYKCIVFENYTFSVRLDNGEIVNLNLWDTAGQEDYDSVRSLSYSNVNIFLVAFSLVSSTSLENIQNKWVSEIKNYSPDAIRVLVGTKKDLRDDEDQVMQIRARGLDNIVETEEGERVCKELKLNSYYECSALTQEGLNELFEAAIKEALYGKKYININILLLLIGKMNLIE